MRGDPDGDGDESIGVSSDGSRLGAKPAVPGKDEGASGVRRADFDGAAQGTVDQTLDQSIDQPIDPSFDPSIDHAIARSLEGAAEGTVDRAFSDLPEVASSGGVTLSFDHPAPHSDGVPVEARAEVESHLPKNDVADGVPVAAGGEEVVSKPALGEPDLSHAAHASRPADEELLEAWRAGDLAAGQRLWRRHAAAVQRFYRNKVPWAVANDLTQRSVEACLRARDRITSFRAYLLSVATRQLFEYIRTERRKRQRDADLETLAIDEAMPSPEEWVGTKREKRILLRALRRIPVVYQVVLELYYWEQLTQNEIAQVLAWPPGTVRTRIGKARRLVRSQIESLCRSHEERLSTIDSFEQWAARTYQVVPELSTQSGKHQAPQSGPIDRDEVPPDDDLVCDEAPQARMARGSMQFAAVGDGAVDERTVDEELLDEGAGEAEGGDDGEGGGPGDSGAGTIRPPRRR